MFRLDARINAVFTNRALVFFVRNVAELRTGDRFGSVRYHAELDGDGNGGVLMVARNHNRTYARLTAGFNCADHFRTHGVDHADEAYKR
ncbi:hypothetical protein SDC9_121956 [bioreactor metagenome]|uniref:Uncharacterized protein n=1 Tax=bioreactor metagenome TaxID=1076179 RepID=A0A645CDD9_9ZZZZ